MPRYDARTSVRSQAKTTRTGGWSRPGSNLSGRKRTAPEEKRARKTRAEKLAKEIRRGGNVPVEGRHGRRSRGRDRASTQAHDHGKTERNHKHSRWRDDDTVSGKNPHSKESRRFRQKDDPRKPEVERGTFRRGKRRLEERGERLAHDRRRADRHVYQHHDKHATPDLMEWKQTEVTVERIETGDNDTGFAALGVPQPLVQALRAGGIVEPFPIQTAAIPDALSGRDLLGRGQTGSGKTLAFGLPMITRLAGETSTGSPRALILAPTRELAMQVADVLSPLASVMGLRTLLVAGGMPYPPQVKALEKGVDIVVATPGRLIDLMDSSVADLSRVRVSILDEADQMADLGFLPEITRILDEVPADAQHLLFSATLDEDVAEVVRRYLCEPVSHGVDPERASVTTMSHLVLHVLPRDKAEVIAHAANRTGKTIIFVRTQLAADRVAAQLRERGVMAGSLHGGLTQGARVRVMHAFRSGKIPVVVATDIAARGIHVDDISLVLQADIPHNVKDYLHRSGRTARAGEAGSVVSIVLPHERRRMDRIILQAGVDGKPRRVNSGDEWLSQVTGGVLPSHAQPIEDETYRALIAPKAMPRRARRPDSFRDRGRDRRRGRHHGRGRRLDDLG